MKKKPSTCQRLLWLGLVSFPARRAADGNESTPPPSRFLVQCAKFAVAKSGPHLRAKSYLHSNYTNGRCSTSGDGFCMENVACIFEPIGAKKIGADSKSLARLRCSCNSARAILARPAGKPVQAATRCLSERRGATTTRQPSNPTQPRDSPAQQPKSPKAEKPKRRRAEEPQRPKAQKPKNPRTQEAKSRRTQEPKSRRAPEG